MLLEKGRGKTVKCLKIYSFSELFPNPKQGIMMHAWWCQPKGNKNKSKIFSLDLKRPYKGIKLWLWMNGVLFFLSAPYKALTSRNSPFLRKQFSKSYRLFLYPPVLPGYVEETSLSLGYVGSFLHVSSLARKPKCYLEIPRTSHGNSEIVEKNWCLLRA